MFKHFWGMLEKPLKFHILEGEEMLTLHQNHDSIFLFSKTIWGWQFFNRYKLISLTIQQCHRNCRLQTLPSSLSFSCMPRKARGRATAACLLSISGLFWEMACKVIAHPCFTDSSENQRHFLSKSLENEKPVIIPFIRISSHSLFCFILAFSYITIIIFFYFYTCQVSF